MQSDFDQAYRATRRQYELGRFATAARHAATAVILVAVVAGLMFGKSALVWLPVTLLVITFTEWRGVFLMKGARRGFVVGIVSMLLPLSILRPCCGLDAKAMGMSCCVMPSACWATGAVVGLAMALLLPKAPEGRRVQAAAGMTLGVTSVAVLRCSMLFVGEAVGLLGGLTAGVIATCLARACLDRLRTTVQ
jgi:hypothetical protein